MTSLAILAALVTLGHQTLSGVGGTAFNALLIPNCVLWLDASDTRTVYDTPGMASQQTARHTCGRWLDKSGNSHDWEAVASAKPVWTTGLQAGKAGITFDGATQYFDTFATNIAGADPWTVFVVGQPLSNAVLLAVFGGTSGSFEARYNNAVFNILRNGIEDVGSGSSAASISAPSLNVATFDHTLDSNQSTFRLNGTSNGTATGHTTASSGNITLGGQEGGGSSLMHGYIFEVVLYNRVLTASEIAYVEKGESIKWKLGF